MEKFGLRGPVPCLQIEVPLRPVRDLHSARVISFSIAIKLLNGQKGSGLNVSPVVSRSMGVVGTLIKEMKQGDRLTLAVDHR